MATVLLASTDGELRRLAAAELARGGHRGLLSSDPLESVLLMSAGGIDAAIVDMELPEPGGEALVARIRCDELNGGVPILAVLGIDAAGTAAAQADVRLSRPLGRTAVTKAVLQLLSRPGGKPRSGPGASR